MGCSGGEGDRFGHRVVGRDDEVVALQSKALNGPGVERQKGAVALLYSREARKRAGVDAQALDGRRGCAGYVNERVEVGRGIEVYEFFEDSFPPRIPVSQSCTSATRTRGA